MFACHDIAPVAKTNCIRGPSVRVRPLRNAWFGSEPPDECFDARDFNRDGRQYFETNDRRFGILFPTMWTSTPPRPQKFRIPTIRCTELRGMSISAFVNTLKLYAMFQDFDGTPKAFHFFTSRVSVIVFLHHVPSLRAHFNPKSYS